jgi:hypothetical protein
MGVIMFLELAMCCLLFGSDVETTPVTFYEAKSATVVEHGDDVRVMLQGGSGKVGYGVLVDTKNEAIKYIEVHDEKKPFPPNVLEPFEPGRFLVAGEPGSVFWISIRADGSPPVWLSITVGERGPPQAEPDDRIYEWVIKNRPDDAKTAEALAGYYANAIAECQKGSYNLAQAKTTISAARRRALLSLDRLSVDWSDFFFELNRQIEPIQDVPSYLQKIDAIVKALRAK